MQIWKYPIDLANNFGDKFELELPEDAKIVSCQVQYDSPVIYCIVKDRNIDKMVKRQFRLAGTGHIVDEHIYTYIGTFMLEDGAFVVHLLEIV